METIIDDDTDDCYKYEDDKGYDISDLYKGDDTIGDTSCFLHEVKSGRDPKILIKCPEIYALGNKVQGKDKAIDKDDIAIDLSW